MAFVSNLGLAFQDVTARFAERTALFYPESDKSVTYAQLSTASERLARILWNKGLRQGQVAAFFHWPPPQRPG